MRFKQGVSAHLQPEMTRVLPTIDAVFEDTIGREAVMTSGNDGQHMAGSRHYLGLAGDFRIRDPLGVWTTTPDQRHDLVEALRAGLNGNATLDRPYNVVLEQDPKDSHSHIHVEYDPK